MSNERQMLTLSGLPTARGFVAGPVFVFHSDGALQIPEYVIEPGREGDELLRLKRALVEVDRDLEHIIFALKERTGREDVKVFECHQMLLKDIVLTGEAEKHIREGRVNAEAAVRRTADHARRQFEKMSDPYFRERIRDLDDIERRLLNALLGTSGAPQQELKAPAIIVADDLTPSETVQLPREYVLGFVLNGGSPTSHVALLARAMGVPSVSGLGNITELVSAGDTLLLDGTNGKVTIAPTTQAILAFRDLIERQKEINEDLQIGLPAGSLRGGGEVRIYANMHPGVPIDGLREHGARGIGLYRSEYLWLNGEIEPTEDEQFAAYKEATQFAMSLGKDASITIRALDIGGDKTVKGISIKEANPFLGNRSIRYLLSNREVFVTQLRAILRASAFGRIYVLYPMISCVEELDEAAKVLAAVKRALDADGIDYDRNIRIGAMIEVPAAAINVRAIAARVDFLSIGTNDLIQYTMAADRGNDRVAHLYQPLNPAVIKLMQMTIDAARERGIKVGVCGESASDPIVGVLWGAMGVDMLSMSATYIPVMSKLFSRLTKADLEEYRRLVVEAGGDIRASEIYMRCQNWMVNKIPDLRNIII